MNKAVLVVDMPENCRDCQYFGHQCRITQEKCNQYNESGRHENCPLIPLPKPIWIPVQERLPEREEWITLDEKGNYLRRMEIAVNSDTIEYFYVYYDGFKWFDKFGRTYTNVVAWKIHEPFNPLN